ncbi:uncharacterized protein BDW43DRAFT_315363 [Aspergillus alliaceus]|uniref:uncharacterized protein n=1 Tax=Petromyces alliaceus TaxID=209559 RepID=UPI0012A67411|nr:uncharacterized protein BDW43DRAFT_315363 [Aspergillus alliaceus]KAB8229027.1 hypothetical protein BDW43DRAFT_315363 [Aspergillus alliaceus]
MFERALKAWSGHWEHDERSTFPLSPRGPLSFTSTALLRLAYVRINLDFSPAVSLNTWGPVFIANSLDHSQSPQRGKKTTLAAPHSASALSVPVRLGIKYVAKTQVAYWSKQHGLCSLECAATLDKWLESVTASTVIPLITG